jgi:hypothetical protein
MDGWMDTWMDYLITNPTQNFSREGLGNMNRWMDGWMDGWMNGCIDEWIDVLMNG